MSKTIIVNGFGPGISNAVAEKFGSEGFTVALVARNEARLAAGVKALEERNIRAHAFVADLSTPDGARDVVERVRDALGPIHALHWNVYGREAGDLLSASDEELRGVFEIPVINLLAAVRSALPDLRAQKGAVLITNGGFGLIHPDVDKVVAQYKVAGLAVANAAKLKVAGVLAQQLAPEGVFVGQVVVTAIVKGTAFDQGNGTLEARDIAAKFWKLYSERKDFSATI